MKAVVTFLLTLIFLNAHSQTDSLKSIAEIKDFQKKLTDEFKSSTESPLEPKEIKKFKKHDFFPINLNYRVTAQLTITEGTPFLQMKTTTERLTADRIYGYVEFAINGKDFKLPVYQSQDLMKNPDYVDYLFFPFSDLTNGKETYGGGRYIDLRIPKGEQNLVVDFNQAYNPYCAYNKKFSCPLIPAANQMDIEIPVGIRLAEHH